MHRHPLLSLPVNLLLVPLALCLACSDDPAERQDEPQVSSHAYKGHESDLDANNFVTVYPAALDTRLDDCQTCHTGATLTYDKSGTTVSTTKNACDYCHLILHPDSSFNEAMPKTYAETLNAYGKAYDAAGRDTAALHAIAGQDSDGDGYSNAEEIADTGYPGDAKSKPGQQVAPQRVFTLAQLKALTAHTQFLLANSTKQEYDEYASYKGVKVKDLLEAAGLDLADKKIQGVTVIAPDGYLKDFTLEQITKAYPAGVYYAGLDNAGLGAKCGFVTYPETLPTGLVSGEAIPGEQWLQLAYERDGGPMEVSNLDVTSGEINGEGPLRVVVPQSTPGKPDRGLDYSPTACGDGYDYYEGADHNAGDMVRGVVAVRVNPMPDGYEDFDYQYGGWAYIDSKSLIVYGYGITAAQ